MNCQDTTVVTVVVICFAVFRWWQNGAEHLHSNYVDVCVCVFALLHAMQLKRTKGWSVGTPYLLCIVGASVQQFTVECVCWPRFAWNESYAVLLMINYLPLSVHCNCMVNETALKGSDRNVVAVQDFSRISAVTTMLSITFGCFCLFVASKLSIVSHTGTFKYREATVSSNLFNNHLIITFAQKQKIKKNKIFSWLETEALY